MDSGIKLVKVADLKDIQRLGGAYVPKKLAYADGFVLIPFRSKGDEHPYMVAYSHPLHGLVLEGDHRPVHGPKAAQACFAEKGVPNFMVKPGNLSDLLDLLELHAKLYDTRGRVKLPEDLGAVSPKLFISSGFILGARYA